MLYCMMNSTAPRYLLSAPAFVICRCCSFLDCKDMMHLDPAGHSSVRFFVGAKVCLTRVVMNCSYTLCLTCKGACSVH